MAYKEYIGIKELELLRKTIKEQDEKIKKQDEELKELREKDKRQQILNQFYSTIRKKKLKKAEKEKLRKEYRAKYGEDYDSYPVSQ